MINFGVKKVVVEFISEAATVSVQGRTNRVIFHNLKQPQPFNTKVGVDNLEDDSIELVFNNVSAINSIIDALTIVKLDMLKKID